MWYTCYDVLRKLQLVVELNSINVFVNGTNNGSAITTLRCPFVILMRRGQVYTESSVGVHFMWSSTEIITIIRRHHCNYYCNDTSVPSLLQLRYHNNINEIQKQQDLLLRTATAAIKIMNYKNYQEYN
jgi:hypothetical protein